MNHLKAYLLQLDGLEHWNLILVNFHKLVKIKVKVFKNYHHVLSELERVQVMHNSVFAIGLGALRSVFKFLKEANFHVCVINIKLLVFADFRSYSSSFWITVINASNNLAESTLVNNFSYFVTVTKLLSDFSMIVTFFIGYLILV